MRTANGFVVGDKVEVANDDGVSYIERILVEHVTHFDYQQDDWFLCSVVKLRDRDAAYLDCNLTRVE